MIVIVTLIECGAFKEAGNYHDISIFMLWGDIRNAASYIVVLGWAEFNATAALYCTLGICDEVITVIATAYAIHFKVNAMRLELAKLLDMDRAMQRALMLCGIIYLSICQFEHVDSSMNLEDFLFWQNEEKSKKILGGVHPFWNETEIDAAIFYFKVLHAN